MPRILIYPPFADPTQPYISLPTLKGYLKSKNMDVKTIDLNIEAAHYLLKKNSLKILAEKILIQFTKLNNSKTLSLLEQIQYKKLIEVKSKVDYLLKKKFDPISILQNKNLFYNYSEYTYAKNFIENIFSCINTLYFPFQFNFNKAMHFILPWEIELLKDYYNNHKSPLSNFYNEKFNEKNIANIDFVGISISFISQIPEAFYLCQLLKTLNSNALIVLGGTCVSQVVFSADEDIKKKLFEFADAICFAEGEETLTTLFNVLDKTSTNDIKKNNYQLLQNIPNLLIKTNDSLVSGKIEIFNMEKSQIPDYSDFDLDKYFAPSRILLYSPTRGCYWNKCSFCDYGFNRGSINKYREIEPQKVIKELSKLSKLYNVNNFYISCDVLSPAYAEKIADQIITNNLKINWSCDLKIEKYYSLNLCKKLFKSGLISVAFGIESGSDKILKIINKGITADNITEINYNFHKAGIATQWMTFTYHPCENTKDALDTINLIEKQVKFIDLFIVGEFGLTSGSRIMKNPQNYLIKSIYFTKGDEFKLFPLYRQKNENTSLDSKEIIDKKISKIADKFELSCYPWAGAISTHHSFLYFIKFGQYIFKEIKNKYKIINSDNSNQSINNLNFSLKQIKNNEVIFLNKYLSYALKPKISGKEKNRTYEAPLSYKHFKKSINSFSKITNKILKA